MSSKKRRQHWVPQFYQRQFSRDGSSVALCRVKSGTVVPRASIKGQCAANYLYDDDGVWEEKLGLLEGDAATLLRQIEADKCLPEAGSDDDKLLLLYTMVQVLPPTLSDDLSPHFEQAI